MAFDVTAEKLQEHLDAIEASLPESFFAGLSLPERVQHLVEEWQRMFTGTIPHAKVAKQDLVTYLGAMRESIMDDDSFEGNLMYSCLEEDCDPGEFRVRIVYRVGNTEGQGGLRMLGVMPEE